jgi:hypothetical protein
MPKRQCTTGGGFRFSGGVGPHFHLEIAGNPIDPIGKGVADISEPSQIAGCKGVSRYESGVSASLSLPVVMLGSRQVQLY